MYDVRLSAAEHVSKREAERLIQKGLKVSDHNDAIEALAADVSRRFCAGRKLSEQGFADLVDAVRRTISACEPLHLEEHSRSASRVRPGGETREFVFAMRSALPDSLDKFFLTPRRLVVSRKRFMMESAPPFILVKRHLLERAIQRNLVAWNGGLPDVEKTILDSMGIASVWRHACNRDMMEGNYMAFPIGSGLLLGAGFSTPTDSVVARRIIIGRDASSEIFAPPNPFNAIKLENGTAAQAVFEFSTVLEEDMLRPAQISFRDDMVRFQNRYKKALTEIGRCLLWPDIQLAPNPTCEDVEPAMDAMARELADLATDPANADAIQGPTHDRRSRKVPDNVEDAPAPMPSA